MQQKMSGKKSRDHKAVIGQKTPITSSILCQQN